LRAASIFRDKLISDAEAASCSTLARSAIEPALGTMVEANLSSTLLPAVINSEQAAALLHCRVRERTLKGTSVSYETKGRRCVGLKLLQRIAYRNLVEIATRTTLNEQFRAVASTLIRNGTHCARSAEKCEFL
jgi:hypothetical protein